MTVPGSNLLNQALRVIAAQQFTYTRYIGRTDNDIGLYETQYAAPETLRGSVQPVPRSHYQLLGLDLEKEYINVFVSGTALPVERDVSGDKLVFNSKNYQCVATTPWSAMDGWVQILAVKVL